MDEDHDAQLQHNDELILKVSKQVAAEPALDSFCLLVPQIRLFPVHITMLRRRLEEGALKTMVGELPPGQSAIFIGPDYKNPHREMEVKQPTVVFDEYSITSLAGIHGHVTAFHELVHYMQYFSGQYLGADKWDREVSAYMAAARWHELVHKQPYSSAGAAHLPQEVMDEARRLVTGHPLRHEFSKTDVAALRQLVMKVTKRDGLG